MPFRFRLPASVRPTTQRAAYATGATLAAAGCYSIYSTFTSSEDDSTMSVDAASLYYSGGITSRSALRMDTELPLHHGLDRPSSTWTPPTREEMLASLGCQSEATPRSWPGLGELASRVGLERFVPQSKKEGQQTSPAEHKQGNVSPSDVDPAGDFDLLVVGGGATGAGVALDAASRGLRVALVERDDFSSGQCSTSALRCFVLIHCILRHLFQIDQASSWRRALPAEGRDGTGLRTIQACSRSLARAKDFPSHRTLFVPLLADHATDLHMVANSLLLFVSQQR